MTPTDWLAEWGAYAQHATKFARACATSAANAGRIESGPGSAANTHPALTHPLGFTEANRMEG